MRVKYNTLSQVIGMNNNTIQLPRNSIHDAYILRFSMHFLNETSQPITPTIKESLRSITEINVTSDSIRTHYNINGYDGALLGARIQKCQTSNYILDKVLPTVQPDGTLELDFTLYLDEGDIVAAAHNNLELRVLFADTTSEGLRQINSSCTVTIIERICTTAELYARYGGKDLIATAEPKVTGFDCDVPASSEFTGFFELQPGCLLCGAVVEFANARNIMPSQIGLLRTVPDRVELAKADYETMRAINEVAYQTKFPEGIAVMNYGTQWQDNGVGKDGWSFSKGDILFAAKTTEPTKARYITIEKMVNIPLYKSQFKFTEY